jgi:predicted nucleic acid-binding protein
LNLLVVDCSVTMAWIFEAERDRYAMEALGEVAVSRVSVPSIWPLEVANVLRTARTGLRISDAQIAKALTMIRSLEFEVAPSDFGPAEWYEFANRYDLTPYDAAYLELALRRGARLATKDERMRRAATLAGVSLL